jgi:hypothetical protein
MEDPKSVYLTDGLYPDPDTGVMVPSASIHIVPFHIETHCDYFLGKSTGRHA